MLSAENRAARAALFDFQSSLFDLRTWLPAGAVGDEQPFDLAGLRVFVQDGAVTPDPGLEQEPQDWPLVTPLGLFGEPLPDLQLRCGTVTGADLATLLPKVQLSNELTPWLERRRPLHADLPSPAPWGDGLLTSLL